MRHLLVNVSQKKRWTPRAGPPIFLYTIDSSEIDLQRGFHGSQKARGGGERGRGREGAGARARERETARQVFRPRSCSDGEGRTMGRKSGVREVLMRSIEMGIVFETERGARWMEQVGNWVGGRKGRVRALRCASSCPAGLASEGWIIIFSQESFPAPVACLSRQLARSRPRQEAPAPPMALRELGMGSVAEAEASLAGSARAAGPCGAALCLKRFPPYRPGKYRPPEGGRLTRA